MASRMKCPLCGTVLVPVGKRGKKVRCDNCRSVFDVSQLNSYYGVGSTVHNAATPHAYETSHMHAVEMRHQAQAVQQQTTTPKQAPIQASSDTSAPEAPAASNRPQQKTPTKKGGSGIGKAILWTVIIACIVIPLFFAIWSDIQEEQFQGDFIAWLNSLDSKSSSSPSESKPSSKPGTTNSGKNSTSTNRSNSNYMPIGNDMNLNASACIGHDSNGKDVLVVEYTWTNCDSYDTSFGVAVETNAQLNGTTLTNTYPKNDTAGYNGDSRYATVKKGQTSTATEAFTLYKNAKTGTLVVSASAWNDALMMDNPPEFTWEFNLAELYASAK